MDRKLVELVRRRSPGRCEYCMLLEGWVPEPFQIDHILAEQHGGPTQEDNLALCCAHCNRQKGPNLAGFDVLTGQVIPLFHPRHQTWSDHFEWAGAFLLGRTPPGRATIGALDLNAVTMVFL